MNQSQPIEMKIAEINFASATLHFLTHIIFSFSISTLCLLPATCLGNAGNETDRLALMEIKSKITVDPYGILKSWNDSAHFCKWQGITCGRKHQRVVSLSLRDLSLVGTISPYIGNLTFLRVISLGNNKFHGEIPAEVGHLFRLRNLYLSRNVLEGAIPVNISYCSELRAIDFYNNRLVGKIPADISFLKKLVFLQLSVNNLTGEIPPSLGNLSSLEVLTLTLNNLQGSIPNQLGQLTSLTVFAIGLNNHTGKIPKILYNISSIAIFSVPQNQLNDSIPANISLTLPKLRIFQIGLNQFHGTLPVSLFSASQLKILDIADNLFEGKVPINLGYLPSIRLLNLEVNFLGDNKTGDLSFITSLTNCTNLKVASFVGNNFGGVLPRSVGNLSTELVAFRIGDNQIFGRIPEEISNLVNLYALSMDGNYFSGSIPMTFGKLQKLQNLALNTNLLSGDIPASFGNITNLYALNLSSNTLEGNITSSIGKCQHLQALDISQNKLTGTIPQEIISLSSLSIIFSLSKNSLTGLLPIEVGKLININTLDVSENKLSGEIPQTIGDCLSLEFLYMQGNLIQGFIPSSVASIRGLQYLDLSRNNLSGNIPKELEQLKFLQFVNLSFNNLEGEVPTKGVFSNASAISLVGNTNLCGGIPELKLPACHVEQKKRKSSIAIILATTISSVVLLMIGVFFYVFYRQKSRKKPSSTPFIVDCLPRISYEELLKATGGFCSENLIGQGSFGSVYRGNLDRQGERLVAVKVLNLHQIGASKSFTAECKALTSIRHRNLVKFLTYCSSIDFKGNDFKALVFNFMTNGSLDLWLHTREDGGNQSRNLSLRRRLLIAVDVSSALHYLHDNCETPVVHRDLKPSNILLDNDMTAHVGDFGLARLLCTDPSQGNTSSIEIKGTIGYMAPEYGGGGEATTCGDVYSFGIILLEIFTGRRPTDEMFTNGLNLRNFVRDNLPGRVMQVVDPMLIGTGELRVVAAATAEEDNDIDDDDEAEIQEVNVNNGDSTIQGNPAQKCIASVLKIGLACSLELPGNRMKMMDVARKLNVITKAFLSASQNSVINKFSTYK